LIPHTNYILHIQVLAHTELELHHEHNLRKREMGLKELGKVNRSLLEEQSMVEIELVNEIALLTSKMHEQEDAHKKMIQSLEQQHNEAISNRERLHKSEILLKNAQMAKLQEEIRVLKGGAPAAAAPKKGGLLSFIPIQKQ
jgi:TolA-binding protein